MLEHVGELRRLRQEIERRNHEARIHDTDQETPCLVAVMQHQRDLVALHQALGQKVTAEFVAVCLELPVIHDAPGFGRDQVGRGG